MPWTNGTQRTSTNQWKNTRNKAKHELDYTCQHKHHTTKCDGPLELDHITNHKNGGTDDLTNLQWLCHHHHKLKTQHEATQARRKRTARAHYPPQKHPGLV